jgi:hypothetical protein
VPGRHLLFRNGSVVAETQPEPAAWIPTEATLEPTAVPELRLF